LFATAQITRMSHYYATQRSGEITGSEYTEGLGLPKPIRDFGWEEKLSHYVRKENKDNEVIEFQETSQRGQTEGLIICCGQTPTRDSDDGYNVCHVFDGSARNIFNTSLLETVFLLFRSP
jgi:hypothetical protein